jgi:cytochrome c oxidase subunit 2
MGPTATSTRQDFTDLFSLYMTIGVVVAALVLGAIVFAVIVNRRRDGRAARQIRALKPLEAIWVAAVAAIVVVLLVSTFRTESRLDALPANSSHTVEVTAFQWGWRFTYPGSGVAVTGNSQRPPALVVPSGVPVRFELTSRDVIHAFWIPALRFKRDAFPNRTLQFDLVFDPGVTTTGRCAEFCGLDHDRMGFQVVSMPPHGFDRWLRSHERGRSAVVSGGPA